MKLLFVDAYHHYLNPTSGLLPALLSAAAGDVTFYGPGFSSPAELERGIGDYVDRSGPYDGVFLGMQVPLSAWDEYRLARNARHIKRYTAFGSKTELLLPFFRDVLQNIHKLPVKFKLISLLNFDYYAATTRHTDLFELLDAYVVTPGDQFAHGADELPDWAWKERHFVRKKSMISNAWIDYLGRNPSRVLSLPHFLADSEFSFRGLADRRERISIPGVEYVLRKQGRRVLAEHGVRPASKPIFNLVRYADRLGLHVFSNFLLLTMYHAAYRGNLIDTRLVYTAREGFGIPVRKFFEIPAAGAVLMCVPPPNFEELGFRGGENFVEVSTESLPDAIEALERDPVRAQTIASAGRNLVFERHSLAARGRQLAQCFEAMEMGCYFGSRWNKGEFEVLTRAEVAVAAGTRA